MLYLPALDRLRHAAHRTGDIVHQGFALSLGHEAEQGARLAVIVIADAMIVAIGIARDLERRLFHRRVLDRPAEGVGLVIHRTALIAIEAHETVAMIAKDRHARLVDRQAVVIDAE